MSESLEHSTKSRSLMNPETRKIPDYLLKQFEEREKYTYGSTVLEAVDVKPETQKTETPVFFGSGWNASRDIYRAVMLGIAEDGRRLHSLFAPQGIDTGPDFGESDNNYAAIELRKAAAMLRVLEHTDVPVDIVAHSEAGIWTLIAASMYPEKIRNIVLVNPGGLIGEDSFPRLTRCFCLDIVKDAINTAQFPRPKIEPAVDPAKDIMAFLKNMFKDPLRSLKAVLAISNSDTRDLLQGLKSKGKHIAVVHSASDEVFPSDKMAGSQDATGAITPGAVNFSMVDGFYSVYGKHNEMNHNPEAYAYVINHALDALEALSKKDTANVTI